MSLTDRDIILFTRDAVFDGAETESAKATCARNALGCYEVAQQAIRDSGYRITKRVKDAIWAELVRLAGEASGTPKLAA